MKYLKTYNESVKDYLKGKTDDEISSEIVKLPLGDALYKSFDNNYLEGVKYVVSKGLDKQFGRISIIMLYVYRLETSKEIVEYLLSLDELKPFIPEENRYVLEKYKLGLHQNTVKDYEKKIIDKISDKSNVSSKETYVGDVYSYKDSSGNELLQYDKLNLELSFNKEIFQDFIKDTKVDNRLLNLMIKVIAEKYLDIEVDGVHDSLYEIDEI